MGSRKRSVLVRKDLEEAGYTKEQVQKLHSRSVWQSEHRLRQRSHFCDQRDRAVQNERAKAAETDEAILEELTGPQRLSKFAVNDENEMEYRMLCTIIEKGSDPEASEPRCWSHRTIVLSEPSAEAVQKLK